jgi:hypothetical protein
MSFSQYMPVPSTTGPSEWFFLEHPQRHRRRRMTWHWWSRPDSAQNWIILDHRKMSSVKNSQIWHEKASGSQIYGFDSFMNVNLHNAECMILCIFVPQTNPLTAEIVEH